MPGLILFPKYWVLTSHLTFVFEPGIQVGWWAGVSEDATDPYGRIIHISAEYGRYIARSYSPR